MSANGASATISPKPDQHHPVAHRLHFLHDVGAEHHGPVFPQAANERADVHQLVGVKPDVGSSKMSTSGSWMSACARPDALPIPLGQLANGLVLLGGQPDLTDDFRHTAFRSATLCKSRHKEQVLLDVHLFVQWVVLRQVTHPLFGLQAAPPPRQTHTPPPGHPRVANTP